MDETREQVNAEANIRSAGPRTQFLRLRNLVFVMLWEQALLIGRIPASIPLPLELVQLRLTSRRTGTR